MLKIMLVLTIGYGGSVHQLDPEPMADLDACIAKGRAAVEQTELDVERSDPDGIRGVGFTCVKRVVSGTDS